MYSGPIAAHAYNLLRGRDIDVAVLVGPSHYVGFEGVAMYERGAFDTPFGRVPIAEQCAAAVAMGSPQIRSHPTAHVREHSLEMQLPFLEASAARRRDCAARHGISAARNRLRAGRCDRRAR